LTEKRISLNLTEAQFLVIYEFLYHTTLGGRNKFEDQITDLMIEMDSDVTRFVLSAIEANLGKVNISVTATQEDGMQFNLN
jgi:hypothetical protein